MGRMKKEHKKIVDYKLVLTYTCPVTKKQVEIELNPLSSISAYENECELCGSHGAITIESPVKCPSCGKMHDDIEWESW